MGMCRSSQAEPVADTVISNVCVTTSPVTQINVLNERNKRRLSVEHIECVFNKSLSPEKNKKRTIYKQSSRAL
jgi:hypothetical protein